MVTTRLDELAEKVKNVSVLSIEGSGSAARFRCDAISPEPFGVDLSGVIQLDAADQVVEVWAGTTLQELQEELAKHGQCIPYAGFTPDSFDGLGNVAGTVGGQLSVNIPHALEADCGNWRDWVLGSTVILADGRIAKSGSKVVKNVTGYDVHKLFIGARGTLGVVVKVALRTWPLRALPPLDITHGKELMERGYIQRTLPSDFPGAAEGAEWTNPKASTLYKSVLPQRFRHDWVIGWGMGQANLGAFDSIAKHYMQRAKHIFDPGGKLNPEAFPPDA